ncbi:P-loop containing nucleoside triphosphate hydrolase protein [Hyaloraphidium curvatum]|nr:P-loop containing nucleoside triphosphate hydrolase protein [Hyaloraphidium curvatum]
MSNNFRDKAIDIVRRATEEDTRGNYEEAYKLYKNALEYFMADVKYEKNERVKEQLKKKIVEYLNRAEKLKEIVDRDAKKKKPVAVGGGGGGGGEGGGRNGRGAEDSEDDEGGDSGGKGKKEDAETKKMKDALSSVIVSEKPNVHWEDIAGLDMAKEALKEAVILPMRFPDLFTGKRTPWKGILLFGPPGTGKTYLAKAVATEANATFLSVSSSDLVSKWMGESEKLVRQLFNMARENKPAIIFIDEVDSIAGSRGEGENEATRRMKTEFLVQMAGVGKDDTGVLVLAATNLPWQLDPAVRRRFERRIYIALPDENARSAMFRIHIGNTPVKMGTDDFKDLARLTEGYSGSDIAVVVRDALMQPVRKVQNSTHFRYLPSPTNPGQKMITPCRPTDSGAVAMSWVDIPDDIELLEPEITKEDFVDAIKRAKRSTNQDDIDKQIKWTEEFGSGLNWCHGGAGADVIP